MTVKILDQIETNNVDEGRLWFNDFKNVIDSIPGLVGFSENKVKIRVKSLLFFTKVLEFEVLKIAGREYIEYKLKSGESNGNIFITFSKRGAISLSVSYSGKFEKQMNGVLKSAVENMKRKYTEHLNKRSDLSSLSLVARIASTSKLAYVGVLDTTKSDITTFIEETVNKFSKYPTIYISATSENGVFRLLFINGVLKGVYVKYGGRESYSEDEIKDLKGTFHVSVYVGWGK